MSDSAIDAYVLRTSDPYLSEYIPRHWRSLEWLSGFTGSAGTLIVTRHGGMLYTDSRYWEQAEQQLAGTGLELVRQGMPGAPNIADWLSRHCAPNARIAASPDFFSITEWQRWDDMLAEADLHLDPVDDLIDRIWIEQRPPRPASSVYPHRESPLSVRQKLTELRRRLALLHVDATLLCALDDIAWLTNCRGSDIDYNPVFLATMAVSADRAVLFTERNRFTPEHLAALEAEGVTVCDDNLFPRVLEILGQGKVLIDPERVSVGIQRELHCDTCFGLSPVTLMKSRKCSEEIASIRDAMLRDGTALCEFYARLDASLARGEHWDELKVSHTLNETRKQQGAFDLSFETIAAFGEHAALPHYAPTPQTNCTLSDGLLLIDSGGQYATGTTDITRMTAVGRVSEEMRRDVTLVLKAMIALARGVFPVGATGAQLDALARSPLWREGLDFGHGTGHGIGFVLNVHEGPFRVSPRAVETGDLGLQPGLVFSDEPGLYRPGQWGVRLENLVTATGPEVTEFGSFLKLETLTLCPIDRRTLNIDLLDEREKHWLDNYHATVRQQLESRLSPEARTWLVTMTEPIGN